MTLMLIHVLFLYIIGIMLQDAVPDFFSLADQVVKDDRALSSSVQSERW